MSGDVIAQEERAGTGDRDNAGMDEVILRTIVIQFDGRVVEVFRPLSKEAFRQHVALMNEPKIGRPDSRGRTPVTVVLEHRFVVDADEMPRLRPLLDKITAAVRAAKAETPRSP
jgi:hypothetical protein